MAVVTKAAIYAYNKCTALATKWQNIIDSFRHVSDKITYDDLAQGVKDVIGNGGGAQTGAEIKAALFAENDTNNFSDEEKQKLADTVNLSQDQNIGVVKTFLHDKLGLRNFANTFTSYLRNFNTASRVYTFQDRNGILADDTDLASKQNKLAGSINYIPKSISEDNLTPSRLLDDGSFLGIGTVYAPTKSVTLGNDSDKEIGVEESDANTVGKNLIISAGRTNDYRTNSVFNSITNAPVSIKSSAISPTTNDFYILGTNGAIYVQANSTGAFIQTSFTPSAAAKNIHISATNDLYVSYVSFGNPKGLWKQTNCTGSFVNILNISRVVGITTRDDDGKVVCSNSSTNGISISNVSGTIFTDIGFSVSGTANNYLTYHNNGNIYYAIAFSTGGRLFIQTGGQGSFIEFNTGIPSGTFFTGIASTVNGNTYISTNAGIYEQINGFGGFTKMQDVDRSYSSISRNPTNGNLYASVGSELFELSFATKGAENLDGGTLKLRAGTGKGNGKSRVEFITGEKLASGTDMQSEIVRGYIDENGFFVYNHPVYADNAAAIAAGLPNNAMYKDNNGNIKSVTII